MTTPEELVRAVESLRAALHDTTRPGVSWIADVARLRVLVARYPGHARAFVGQWVDQISRTGDIG